MRAGRTKRGGQPSATLIGIITPVSLFAQVWRASIRAGMADRYFVQAPIASDDATLDGAEAHHLAHVMRARPGTEVTLFDGTGCEYQARVERVGRSEIQLSVLSRAEVNRELSYELNVAVALPKGDRQKWLIEKLTELGVTSVVPLITERSVAEPTPSALKRLTHSVIEASKQCGRNRLMQIEPSCEWTEFAAEAEGIKRIAHPGGNPSLAKMIEGKPATVWLAIGPEGGFDDTEVRLALDFAWRPVSFGPRILRVETAAVYLAS